MGCVTSKPRNQHPNIFNVMNVNDSGQVISPGQLEVTETELVLHQKGKSPTRWPLSFLRKYGCDSELFTFECGRRCPTGQGIYAFRCRKAEQLFNLLQHNLNANSNVAGLLPVNGSAHGEPAVSTGPAVQRRPSSQLPEGYLNPVNNQTIQRQHPSTLSRPGSMNSSNGPVSPSTISPPPSANDVHFEHNNNKRGSLVSQHNYTNTSILTEGNSTASYMNVGSNIVTGNSTNLKNSTPNLDNSGAVKPSTGNFSTFPGSSSSNIPNKPNLSNLTMSSNLPMATNLHSLSNTSSTNLPSANLPSSNLPLTNLSSSNIPVTGSSLANQSSGNSSVINLPSTNLPLTNLPSTNSPLVNLPSVNLPSVNQPSVNLPSANLPSGNLSSTNLPPANLSSANIPSANLPSENPLSENLSSSNLQSSNLPGSKLHSSNLPLSNPPPLINQPKPTNLITSVNLPKSSTIPISSNLQVSSNVQVSSNSQVLPNNPSIDEINKMLNHEEEVDNQIVASIATAVNLPASLTNLSNTVNAVDLPHSVSLSNSTSMPNSSSNMNSMNLPNSTTSPNFTTSEQYVNLPTPDLTHLPNSNSKCFNTNSKYFPHSNSHFPNSSSHFPNSNTHFPNSNSHFPNSNSHFPNSNSHFPNSNSHFPNSTSYFPNSISHFPNSHIYFPNSNCHLYMNVTTSCESPNLVTKSRVPNYETDLVRSDSDVPDERHCYANINPLELPQIDCLRHERDSVPPTPTTNVNLNYLEIEFKENSGTSSKVKIKNNLQLKPEVSNVDKSYVTIDLIKTNALSQSINNRMEPEEGSRKTRHNSSIEPSPGRHRSSLSD